MDVNEVNLSGTVTGILYPRYKSEDDRWIYVLLSVQNQTDGKQFFDTYRLKVSTKQDSSIVKRILSYQKENCKVFVKGYVKALVYKDTSGKDFYSNNIIASSISN